MSEEMTNYLIADNRSYFGLKSQLKSQLHSRKTKILIHKTLVRPILIYAVETRTTKNYERRLSIFKRKILCRIYGPICKGGQWQKRYYRELEELHNEPNTVNVIKYSRLRWAGHVVRMVENNLPKKILWTNPEGQLGNGPPKSRLIDGVEKDTRKLGYMNWPAMPKTEFAGDICLGRPRPIQGCRVDDGDSCAERVMFNNC